MRNQRGYINSDGWGCAFLVLAGLCAVVGMALLLLAQWLWPILKAWIHAITAGGAA